MKKFLFLILTSILTMPLFAQLEVKEGSFKEVAGFVNINTERMYDDNDRAYAVVKVKTENINDKERRQLLFEGDARTFFELEYKPGEVWVYISYYASYLKISHPDFGTTEFTFPFDMVGKKGYELTLIKKPSVDQEFADRLAKLEGALAGGTVSGEFGYLVIKTTPVDGAMVVIDGEEMAVKTPFVSEKLGVGPHRVRVEKEFYKPYVTVVNIEEGKSKNLDVELIKAIGSLEIVTHPDNANIVIDRRDKGSTPKTFDNMPAGNYKVELSKKKYVTVVRDVVVKDGENTLLEVDLEKVFHNKSLRKKGWVFRPEIGGGVTSEMFSLRDNSVFYNVFIESYLNNNNKIKDYSYGYITMRNNAGYDHFNLNCDFGYQLNPYVFLGASIGLDFNDLASFISMPLCLNPRFYFNNRKTSVYVDLKIGMSINVKSSKPEIAKAGAWGYYYNGNEFVSSNSYEDFITMKTSFAKISGLTCSVEFGIEYKRSSFGLALCLQKACFETTFQQHYYSFGDYGEHGFDETPTNYHNALYTYSPENFFCSLMFKYGYSIFVK